MAKRTERQKRREAKNAEVYQRMQERMRVRDAARVERLARRRRNHKRWRVMQPDSPLVKARKERAKERLKLRNSVIGEPNSPYEIAIAVVEMESGEKRTEWESVLKHPNNIAVNDLARKIALNELDQSDVYRLNQLNTPENPMEAAA